MNDYVSGNFTFITEVEYISQGFKTVTKRRISLKRN
jgi:hypothetical protein